MAKPVVYNWIAADAAAVCLLQTVSVPATDAIINGTLSTDANPNITGLSSQPPAIAYFNKISRAVTISSANDVSHINFTITGTYNGQTISETLAGPNVGTVSTVKLFQTVTRVSVNGDAVGFTVGTGQTGYTQWFSSNIYATGQPNTSVQVDITGVITYTFEVTLDDVNTVPDASVNSFIPLASMHNATASAFDFTAAPFRYARIHVSASTGAATLTATMMQQGIT